MILAAGFNLITVGQLPTMLIYEFILFLSYVLPGITFYYPLRHVGFGQRAAFAAGLFDLVFPAVFDGSTGAFIGMIGSRLAFALNPVVLVWAIDYVESRGVRYAWLAVGVEAIAILCHPYHLVGIIIAFAIYLVFRRVGLFKSILRLAVLVLSPLAIAAFWLIPALVYSRIAMVPLVRGTLDQTWRQLTDPLLLPYILLCVPAILRLRSENEPSRRTFILVLIALPLVIAGVILGEYAIFIERLHVYTLDPLRLIGEFYMPILLLAGIGVREIGDWLGKIFSRRNRGFVAGGVAAVACLVFAIPFVQGQSRFYPDPNGEPRFLSQAIDDYHFGDLWKVLAETPGRILFTSAMVHLHSKDQNGFDTTIPSLTPLFSNRGIIGGTFTHWSPIAALLWTGTSHPAVLRGLIQDQDDKSLFGIPIAELTDQTLFEYCRRLNITALVANVDDFQMRTMLDSLPHFQSYYNNGEFFVYRVKSYDPSWIESSNADVQLDSWADDEIRLSVNSAKDAANVEVKTFAYPLWQAETGNSQKLEATGDDLGLMRIDLPAGLNYYVIIRYEGGPIEQASSLISWLSLTLFAVGGLMIAWKRR